MKIVKFGVLALIAITPAMGQVQPKLIFRCRLGEKTVEVVQANAAYIYRYGKTGATPEIELRSTGKDGKLFSTSEHNVNARGMSSASLRFVNGAFSYEIFTIYDGSDPSATFDVMNGRKVISSRVCTDYETNIDDTVTEQITPERG